MHVLYLLSVTIHILAATAWIGGIFFLMLVVVPWLKSAERANTAAFLRDTGQRFRTVAWWCFGILLVTGTFQLWVRGVRFESFAQPGWLAAPFGRSVALKLTLFSLVLTVSAIHDFVVGPRATAALQRDPRSAETARLRRYASLLGRADALLAIFLVATGVTLVRGWPW